MNVDLSGRTALITGGSLGLGLAMGEAFYGAGARVALLARRAGPLDDACSKLRHLKAPQSARVEGYVCDVADAAQVDRIRPRIEASRLEIVHMCVHESRHQVFPLERNDRGINRVFQFSRRGNG